jgi:hypothetical protein
MRTPRNHNSFPWSINKTHNLDTIFIIDKHEEEQLDYIKENTNETTLRLHTPSGTGCRRRFSR